MGTYLPSAKDIEILMGPKIEREKKIDQALEDFHTIRELLEVFVKSSTINAEKISSGTAYGRIYDIRGQWAIEREDITKAGQEYARQYTSDPGQHFADFMAGADYVVTSIVEQIEA